MGNYCKTIKKVFDPAISPPAGPSPFGVPVSELNWTGSYTRGIVRRFHFLGPKLTKDQREKEFNRYLLHRYRDWYDF